MLHVVVFCILQILLKSDSMRKFIIPDEHEEQQINQGINSDSDTFIPSDEQFLLFTRSLGRPISEQTKTRITIRLSPEVVEAFRLTGAGWQTRIDSALKQYLSEHSITEA